MNNIRRDAWKKEEDVLLAETVLRYIRNGKTQLDAFKFIGENLSRTSAACGFRWNAAIRKKYVEAVQHAKMSRKSPKLQTAHTAEHIMESKSIETAISLLEKVRENVGQTISEVHVNETKYINELKEKNRLLKQKITRYQEAWTEIEKIWEWALDSE